MSVFVFLCPCTTHKWVFGSAEEGKGGRRPEGMGSNKSQVLITTFFSTNTPNPHNKPLLTLPITLRIPTLNPFHIYLRKHSHRQQRSELVIKTRPAISQNHLPAHPLENPKRSFPPKKGRKEAGTFNPPPAPPKTFSSRAKNLMRVKVSGASGARNGARQRQSDAMPVEEPECASV